MKKSLIALAALAATGAFAQSTVTISGLVDTGYQLVNTAGVKTQGVAANGTGTTVLTVAGSEDLGGGLKANFQLQITPDFINGAGVEGSSNTADFKKSVGTGQQAYVGLAGGFGEVQAGRVNSNVLDAWGNGSVFGTAIGSGYSSNGNIYTRYSASATATAQSAPTRFNGAIRYISPSFNGFSGSLLVVPKGADTGVQTVTDFGLKYNNGPLNVMFASQEIKQSGAVTAPGGFLSGTNVLTDGATNKVNALSANYAIGAATVYGAYWTEKQTATTAVDAQGYMLGAKYVMGATTLLASYGNNDDKTAANKDGKIAGIGADYALSKRTNLYVRYDDRTNATATNDSVKRTAFGVKHTF